MAKCDACGNDYDKSFEVRKGGRTYIFDSFECAIHRLAPTCEHCGVRIVGPRPGKGRADVLLRSLRRASRSYRAA